MNIDDSSYYTMIEIYSKWYPVSKRTLEHNCEMTSSLLQVDWETNHYRSQIWMAQGVSKSKVKTDKRLKGVNLWTYSSDFGRISKRSVSRKSKSWSYKFNRPANAIWWFVMPDEEYGDHIVQNYMMATSLQLVKQLRDNYYDLFMLGWLQKWQNFLKNLL